MYKMLHPGFGFSAGEPDFFTGYNNIRYVASSWGPYGIYAIVPLEEIFIRHSYSND